MTWDLRKVIYNIQCELGELRTLITNGFKNLVLREETVVVDGDTKEINFTGEYVTLTQTEEGKVNVDISVPAQMQPNWTESDPESPSFILNKPDFQPLVVEDEALEVSATTNKINFVGPDVIASSPSAGEVLVEIETPLSDDPDNGITREVDGLYFRKNYSDGGLPEYADDAAAAIGGIEINQWYRTGSVIKIRVA